jgi:hypothetical protein
VCGVGLPQQRGCRAKGAGSLEEGGVEGAGSPNGEHMSPGPLKGGQAHGAGLSGQSKHMGSH